jgi:hypothetical protein
MSTPVDPQTIEGVVGVITAAEIYQQGRVDERLNVDGLLQLANEAFDALLEGSPTVQQRAKAAVDQIKDYRKQTEEVRAEASKKGWI